MKTIKYFLLLLAIALPACAHNNLATKQGKLYFDPPETGTEYTLQIKVWQDRFRVGAYFGQPVTNQGKDHLADMDELLAESKRTGWTDEFIESAANRLMQSIKYVHEPRTLTEVIGDDPEAVDCLALDKWQTYGETIDKGFKGDCEDIAIFTFTAFKLLGMPNDIRLLIYRSFTDDHCLLIYRSGKTGKWKTLDYATLGFLRDVIGYPIVSFNEIDRWDYKHPSHTELYGKAALLLLILI